MRRDFSNRRTLRRYCLLNLKRLGGQAPGQAAFPYSYVARNARITNSALETLTEIGGAPPS
jgi:hypothetical protein